MNDGIMKLLLFYVTELARHVQQQVVEFFGNNPQHQIVELLKEIEDYGRNTELIQREFFKAISMGPTPAMGTGPICPTCRRRL